MCQEMKNVIDVTVEEIDIAIRLPQNTSNHIGKKVLESSVSAKDESAWKTRCLSQQNKSEKTKRQNSVKGTDGNCKM